MKNMMFVAAGAVFFTSSLIAAEVYAAGPPSESDVVKAVGVGPLQHVRCGPATDGKGGYICSYRRDQKHTLFGTYSFSRLKQGFLGGWTATDMQ